MLLAIDLHADLIDVERITKTMMLPFERTIVSSAKLHTPESNGFVADSDATLCEQVFNITVAYAKSTVESDGVTDNVVWKPMTFITIHHRIFDQWQLSCQQRFLVFVLLSCDSVHNNKCPNL